MGFNATVVVNLDGLQELRKDPQAGEKIAMAVSKLSLPESVRGPNVRIDSYGMAVAYAIESHHADYYSIVAVGDNGAIVLSKAAHTTSYRKAGDTDEIALLRHLADQHGFNLHKKPNRK